MRLTLNHSFLGYSVSLFVDLCLFLGVFDSLIVCVFCLVLGVLVSFIADFQPGPSHSGTGGSFATPFHQSKPVKALVAYLKLACAPRESVVLRYPF